MSVRLSKIILLMSVAVFASLIVFNNVTDYNSNYQFVQHVLSMDTTFPGNNGMWRAIRAPFFHHALYIVIILVETLTAILCWWGTFQLWQARQASITAFNQAKKMGVFGLTVGIILFFGGFIIVGGEWFLTWQSPSWNGQQGAFRFVTIMGIFLVYLVIPEREDNP